MVIPDRRQQGSDTKGRKQQDRDNRIITTGKKRGEPPRNPPIIPAANSYLGRYTHKTAISNHRLVDFDGTHVRFRWRDLPIRHFSTEQ